ncbi:hypothetical protein QVM41_32635, partial [Pseudomonas shirazica]
PQAGGREVQAATIARKTLAYDFFRILRAPQEAMMFMASPPRVGGQGWLARAVVANRLRAAEPFSPIFFAGSR